MRRTKRIALGCALLAAFLCGATAAEEYALDRALSLFGEERLAEARQALEPVLERDPGHSQARLLLGILDARTGRVSDAIRTFEGLLRDHPAMFEPYNNLAVLYAVQGRLDEARETLLAALEHQSAAVVYENLGDVYSDLARRAYLRARSLDGGSGASSQAPESDTTGAGSLRTGSCARAGGFESLEAAAAAVEWLRDREVGIAAVRLEEKRSVASWRVFLPPLESHERAAETVRDIQGAGVRDVAIIGDGDLKNGVSFGVYQDEKNMRRRLSALEALGYAARSVPVDVESADEYVIELSAPGDAASEWKTHFPDHPIRTAACSEVSLSQ